MQAPGSVIHNVADARAIFSTYFTKFCKNKIEDGWLAEREDPKKLKESSTNILAIVNKCYNKSWVPEWKNEM